MNAFADNAARIFEAAQSASQSGQLSEMTILIGSSGGIRMVADSDWPLESLRAHHGAQMGFRVSQQDSSVRLEGRSGAERCTMEATRPDWTARALLQAPIGRALGCAEVQPYRPALLCAASGSTPYATGSGL